MITFYIIHILGSSGGGGGSGSSEAITKLGEQLATLKTNVIGLGNYINSVNRNTFIPMMVKKCNLVSLINIY